MSVCQTVLIQTPPGRTCKLLKERMEPGSPHCELRALPLLHGVAVRTERYRTSENYRSLFSSLERRTNNRFLKLHGKQAEREGSKEGRKEREELRVKLEGQGQEGQGQN